MAGLRFLALPALLLLSITASPAVASRAGEFLSQLLLPSSSSPAEATCGPSVSIETPFCELVKEKKHYEIREYPAGQMWATTVVDHQNYSAAIVVGFYRCFEFISGNNKENVTIEMTAPVLIKPAPESKGWSISFFVPSEFSPSSVPQPSNSLVTIVEQKERVTRAVLGPFGGFPNNVVYFQKWEQLKADLKADSVKFNEESLVFAGYSSPFTIINRKQEIWVDIEA